jgi:hypothetical protein
MLATTQSIPTTNRDAWNDKSNPRFGGRPLGFEAGDANLYRYVNNSPTNQTDPSGLAPVERSRWPSWLVDMVNQEGVTGGRGVIRRIIEVNQDFSHARGADGSSVPAHYDVTYVDENGQERRQRFRRDAAEGGRRAFTDAEHDALQQNRETQRAARRARRNVRPDRLSALGVLGVYLTVRDAVEAAGVGPFAFRVEQEATYYFTMEDGSVFYLQYYEWPASMFANSRRVFVAGPRRGETEQVTNAQVAEIMAEGERLYGRYIPGGLFSDPRFIPGTLRRTLPVNENGRRIGYLDENGFHRGGIDYGVEQAY